MKALTGNATLMLLAISTAAYASTGAESGGGSIMVWVFFGFLGCIILLQFVPGMTLFFGMMKGLFSGMQKKGKAMSGIDSRSD